MFHLQRIKVRVSAWYVDSSFRLLHLFKLKGFPLWLDLSFEKWAPWLSDSCNVPCLAGLKSLVRKGETIRKFRGRQSLESFWILGYAICSTAALFPATEQVEMLTEASGLTEASADGERTCPLGTLAVRNPLEKKSLALLLGRYNCYR